MPPKLRQSPFWVPIGDPDRAPFDIHLARRANPPQSNKAAISVRLHPRAVWALHNLLRGQDAEVSLRLRRWMGTHRQNRVDNALTTSIKTTHESPSGGRHHLGMMGAIILDWMGGIVGIRTSVLKLATLRIKNGTRHLRWPKRTASRSLGRAGKKRVTAALDPTAHKQLKSLAMDKEVTTEALLAEAISDLLTKHDINRSG